MSKQKYFLLIDGEYNIGVVKNDAKVEERIYTALKEHFSQNDILIENFKLDTVKNGNKEAVQFINDDEDIVEFTIEETWVY